MSIEQPKTYGEALEVLKRFGLKSHDLDVFEIAKALLKAEADGMNNPGDCETCRFIDWDGDYGTIQCCGKDVVTFRDDTLEVDDDNLPFGECPLWDSNAPSRYCKKHKRWYTNSWELACPSCFKDWENEAKDLKVEE